MKPYSTEIGTYEEKYEIWYLDLTVKLKAPNSQRFSKKNTPSRQKFEGLGVSAGPFTSRQVVKRD